MRSYTKRNIKKPPSKRRTRRVQRGGTVEYDEKFVRLYYFPLSIKTTLLKTPGLIEDIDTFAAGNAPPVIACWLDASNPYGNGTRPTTGALPFAIWTDLSPFKRRVATINTLIEYGDVGPFIGSISSGTNILTIESFTTSNKAVIAFKRVITATGIPAGTFIKGQQSIATSANGVPGKEGVYLLNNTATANITSATFGYETTTGYKTAIATENYTPAGSVITKYPSATFGQFGVPSVSVSGGYMIPSFPRSKNYTTFMVLCLDGLRNAGTLFMHSGTTNTDNTKMIHSKLTGTTTGTIGINTQGFTSSNVNTVSIFSANTLTYFLVSMTGTSAGITTIRIFNSSGNELYTTSQTANAVVPDVTDTNHSPLFIGRTNSFYVSNVQPNVFTGNIHEFIYVQGAILEEDRNLIEAYLVRKWGTIYDSAGTAILGKPIQLNANHPYNWYGGNFGVDLDTGYSAWYRVTSGATASGQIASAATASAPIGYANILKGLDIPNGRFIFKFGATREKIIVSISPGLVIPDGVFNYTTPVRYIRIRPPAVDGTGTISLSQIFVRNQNGTEMLSLAPQSPLFLPNKIIYASGTFSGRSPTKLIDGVTTARADGPNIWKNNGSRNDFVEIDLGSLVVISEIEIYGVNASTTTALNTVLDPNLKNMRLELNTTTDATDIINDIITASTARASAAIASGQIASAAIASVPVASGQRASAAIASAATASGQIASAAIGIGNFPSMGRFVYFYGTTSQSLCVSTAISPPNSGCISGSYGYTTPVRYIRISPPAVDGTGTISLSQIIVTDRNTVNISTGKPVYASGTFSGRSPRTLVDGVTTTRTDGPNIWKNKGSRNDFVEIDLGSLIVVSGVNILGLTATTNDPNMKNVRLEVKTDTDEYIKAFFDTPMKYYPAIMNGELIGKDLQIVTTNYTDSKDPVIIRARKNVVFIAYHEDPTGNTTKLVAFDVDPDVNGIIRGTCKWYTGTADLYDPDNWPTYNTVETGKYVVQLLGYLPGQLASSAVGYNTALLRDSASAAIASWQIASAATASAATASGQIASAAIASGQIASGQRASAAIASGQIASTAIASAAIASGQRASAAIASGQIASTAIASASIASAPVASAAIASAAIASGQRASAAIASGQIASTAIASAAEVSGQQASAAYASGQQASTANASGQQASAAYASGQQASAAEVSGQQASAAYASGQQASTAYASGQQASTAYASGQQASAAEVSGQQASTANASGQQASAAYASGQQASAAEVSGQQASTANASGQQASTAYASGQQASAAYASGQQASAAEVSGQQASTANASGQQASTAYASGQQASAAYASGQQASTANASGQQASTANASGQQASAANASGQQASAAYASGQQASAAEVSGQQASTANASGQQASTANASGQQASAAYASGQQASTANASGQQASAQMASAAQASAAYASGQQASAAYASAQMASAAQVSAAYASRQIASNAIASNALGLKWLGHDPPIGKFIIRPIRP